MTNEHCEYYKEFDCPTLNPRVSLSVDSVSGMRELLAGQGCLSGDCVEILDDSGQGPRVEVTGFCHVVNEINRKIAVVTPGCVKNLCGKNKGKSCTRKPKKIEQVEGGIVE